MAVVSPDSLNQSLLVRRLECFHRVQDVQFLQGYQVVGSLPQVPVMIKIQWNTQESLGLTCSVFFGHRPIFFLSPMCEPQLIEGLFPYLRSSMVLPHNFCTTSSWRSSNRQWRARILHILVTEVSSPVFWFWWRKYICRESFKFTYITIFENF